MKKRTLPLFITGTIKKNNIKSKQSKLKFEKEKKSNFSPILTHHPKLYSYARLKEHCSIRNLSVSGLKNDLIDRIIRYEEKKKFVNWPVEKRRRERKKKT